MAEWDNGTKDTVQKIPLLTVRRRPHDAACWRIMQAMHAALVRQADESNLLLQVSAGPRDKEGWGKRLREVRRASFAHQYRLSMQARKLTHILAQACWLTLQELQALIKYIQINKVTDSDWFTINPSKDGIKW